MWRNLNIILAAALVLAVFHAWNLLYFLSWIRR